MPIQRNTRVTGRTHRFAPAKASLLSPASCTTGILRIQLYEKEKGGENFSLIFRIMSSEEKQ
jgi:hypothetical protein